MNKEKLQQIMSEVRKPEIQPEICKKKSLTASDYSFIPAMKKNFLSGDEEKQFYTFLRLAQILESNNDAIANLIVLSILSSTSTTETIQGTSIWSLKILSKSKMNAFQQGIAIKPTVINICHVHGFVSFEGFAMAEICKNFSETAIQNNDHYLHLAQKFIEEYSLKSKGCIWIDWSHCASNV